MQPLAPLYEYQPSFILGFHGCDKATADRILCADAPAHLKPSEKDYDWLGSGIYFWEGNYARALDWACERQREGKIQTPAVIGAIIDLRLCLDLFDLSAMQQLRHAHVVLKKMYRSTGQKLPRNVGPTPDKGGRLLDCLVIKTAHQLREDQHLPSYDSVRGPFLEGRPIYSTSGFRTHTHIQICVRNTQCIKGYFRPMV
ncbi:hypothetical protein [Melaminivora sp.]|uniref:hypothetical protein n=1 Tax=Melaminivora sp. TaxID=1933032 RepID=UPI0028B191C7|nr:hypothetical protein [Melaminivora sp.]